MRTDSDDAMTQYLFGINPGSPTQELDAHLDVSRSMGRLFCSLIQYWMFKYPNNGITKVVEKELLR